METNILKCLPENDQKSKQIFNWWAKLHLGNICQLQRDESTCQSWTEMQDCLLNPTVKFCKILYNYKIFPIIFNSFLQDRHHWDYFF